MTLRLVVSVAIAALIAGCLSQQQDVAPGRPAEPTVMRMQRPDTEVQAGNSGTLINVSAKDIPAVAEGKVTSRIRAVVNGQAILDTEVREAVGPYMIETLQFPEPERTNRQKEIIERETSRLIERELLLQDAFALLGKREAFLGKLKGAASKEFDKTLRTMKSRLNFKSDDELKAYLRSQGMTVEGVRRQIERNFMSMEYLRSLIFPAIDRINPEQLLEYYQQHPSEFEVTDNVKWQDIFIDAGRFPDRQLARQFAQDIVAKAQAGEDFQKLAVKYDNGDSSYRNGEGFGTRRGEIKPAEAERILFALRDGQIGPIIELGNGFHVVRLVKREYAGRMPFDEKTQTAIRNKLTGLIWDRENKRIVANLRNKATIEVAPMTP